MTMIAPEAPPVLDPTAHSMHIEHSIYDDNLHLICECGWTMALPFWPSPEDVVTAQHHHLTGA